MLHLGHGRNERQPPGPQQADAIAHALDLRQHVGRQEHGAPVATHVVEQGIQRLLHHRVETLGRLVEDDERRVVLERLDEAELALHPGAVLAQLTRQIAGAQREAVQQAPAAAIVAFRKR